MTTLPTRPAKSARRKVAAALLAALATLAITALAVYASTSATGGSTSAGASAKAGMTFTIDGGMASPVALGGTGQPVDLSVTNPNPQTLTVTEFKVTVAGTSVADCAVEPNFQVNQTSASLTVPPRSTAALPAASRPRVVWSNTSVRQNACLGAALRLAYTGKGTLR